MKIKFNKMSFKYQAFGKGDFDATLGLLFDGMSKIISAVGIMIFIFGMPASFVLGKILPAIGIATFLGNIWYAYEAWRLAHKEKRNDVTALPYGIGAAQVASWLFLIMGPIYWQTHDAMLAFRVGLAAGFIGGLIEIAGAFLGKFLSKILPISALLGNLSSSAFMWLSIAGIIIVFNKPEVAVIPFFIVLMGYIARMPMLANRFPVGVLAIVVGIILAWTTGNMNGAKLIESFSNVRIYYPSFFGKEILLGLKDIIPYLPIVVPLQICNFLTTLQGIEAAKQAGDEYPERESMFMDGLFTTVGAFLGNPFPTTVYYGHIGWKSIDARASYSFFVGVLYIILTCSGLTGVIMNLIPYEVVTVLLVFVGISVAVSAYKETEIIQIPVIIISLIPIVAQYVNIVIGSGIQAAGGNIAEISLETFASFNLAVRGISLLANGAFLISLLWSTWLAYLIMKRYLEASISAFVMCIFSIIGMIHSSSISLFEKDATIMAFCYLIIATITLLQYFILRKNEKTKV